MAGFLDLSPELRNHIYELTIPSGKMYESPAVTKKDRARPPAICRASRQLRRETLPIWRENNTFVFGCGGSEKGQMDMDKYLEELTESGIQYCQNLTIIDNAESGKRNAQFRCYSHTIIRVGVTGNVCGTIVEVEVAVGHGSRKGVASWNKESIEMLAKARLQRRLRRLEIEMEREFTQLVARRSRKVVQPQVIG